MRAGVQAVRRCLLVAIMAVFIVIGFGLLIEQKAAAHTGISMLYVTETMTLNQDFGLGPLESSPNEVTTFMPLPLAETVDHSVDCAVESCLALTFDDGPNDVTTAQVLDALDHAQAKATFFVIGNRVAQHVDLLRRMQTTGNEIGNHSWSHPDFTKLNSTQIRDQIDRTQNAITAAGLPAPRFFRPPYEARNDQIRRIVNMPFVLWNIDPEDWRAKKADDLANSIIAQAKPGGIIVMHDTKLITVQALPQILDKLKTSYRFVTVGELLNLPPDAHGEYMSR